MYMNKQSSPASPLEMQEIIDKLIKRGYGKYVECLLEHHDKCYTKKDRLNKSALLRILGCKGKELEDALEGMRETLKDEFDFIWDALEED